MTRKQEIGSGKAEARHNLLLFLPLFYGTGIGLFLLSDGGISLFFLIIPAALSGVVALRFGNGIARFFAAALGVVVLGYANVALHSYFTAPPLNRPYYKLHIEARIGEVEMLASARRLVLENVEVVGRNWKHFPKRIRIKVNGLRPRLSVGDRISTRVNLMPPPVPVYPGSYDFSTKAWFEGLGAVGYNVAKVELMPPSDYKPSLSDRFATFMGKTRETISAKIRAVLPQDDGRVAASLVIGEQSSISAATLQNYRDSGLVHILSVSGAHMSVLAFLVFAAVRRFLTLFPRLAVSYDIKKISALIAIIVTFLYLTISGQAVPAQRSFIMVFVVFAAIIIDRRAISLHSIAIAALLILTLSPQSLLNPGFQMSFAAVALLIAFYENNYVRKGKTITSMTLIYVYGIILTAFIGTLATSVYAIYHFNRFSVYSILSNLLATTAFGVIIMPVLLISVVAMPFGLEEYPLQIAGYGIELMNGVAAWVSGLPGAVLLVPNMSIWTLLAVTVGGYLFLLIKGRWRYLGLLPVLPMFIGFFTYEKPAFIINGDSTLVAVRDRDELVLSPGTANRMERQVWLNSNAQDYDRNARRKSKALFAELCTADGSCSYESGGFRFVFVTDKKVKGRELYIYENNVLYQHINKNDLRENKTMVFYTDGNSLTVSTVRDGRMKWWR